MNYNKKRMIVALHLTVSSVMLLSGFTSPGTKMNTAGDLRYAGGEIAVQIGDSVVDRIYIGHIPNVGVSALAGVGVCMPLIMLVSAFV